MTRKPDITTLESRVVYSEHRSGRGRARGAPGGDGPTEAEEMVRDGRIRDATTVAALGLLRVRGLL